jgi:hypoxanthine-DNA glycosylase
VDVETHPFTPFVPENATVLIVGSFPGREQTQAPQEDAWFYGAKRNQFWTILREVYGLPLVTTAEKQQLFLQNGIAITDIFLKVRRKENNNLDTNLEVIEYNQAAIAEILRHKEFQAIFFTSRFVEKHFKKIFPHAPNTECLPSPSPRFARMTLAEKVEYYRGKLPR